MEVGRHVLLRSRKLRRKDERKAIKRLGSRKEGKKEPGKGGCSVPRGWPGVVGEEPCPFPRKKVENRYGTCGDGARARDPPNA